MQQSLRRILTSLEKNKDAVTSELKDAVNVVMLLGRNDAVTKAPAAFGKLRQGIGIETQDDFNKFVISNENYSAYVEFGTGGKVKVPNEWQELAIQAKGKTGKSFDDFLDNIKDWCRLKRIDEKFAYPIAVSILKNGIEPRPFMFPAFQKLKKNFKKEINAIARKPR
jgi:hypothetical protein